MNKIISYQKVCKHCKCRFVTDILREEFCSEACFDEDVNYEHKKNWDFYTLPKLYEEYPVLLDNNKNS